MMVDIFVFFHTTAIFFAEATVQQRRPTNADSGIEYRDSTMSTPTTAAEISKEIEELNFAIQNALLSGNIVAMMKELHPRIVGA
jgi:hypothetical protein